MQGFREIFETYGADYQATMTRFIGNETMYLRFLDMLFQDPNLQKLGDALESGDLTAAFGAAHTLKGVAANMGLAPLGDAVSAIVEPLRNREQRGDYPVLYRAIQAEFERADDLRRRLKGGE
ncbi:Hpt domain-containing protein [Clostridiaceae bacterium NSJ-31]|uniref:Hpt domain-containing protein n=3 Tax=Ligaoa zhengdingensis TaxID=2763658 RepID=A0A926E0Q1_9FIRM|nr:Hpt domain-containing protein [Ligaoa zhengdingensis]MBC8547483.1 Hpt domain-containing protein [Ligaoa zhengdingensis]